jgi:hypothetical protein
VKCFGISRAKSQQLLACGNRCTRLTTHEGLADFNAQGRNT